MRSLPRPLRRIALALLAIVVLAPSALAQEWVEAYRRGMEALRQRRTGRAIELFQLAARLQPEGAGEVGPRPGGRAGGRMDWYHPNLRLAEAYLLAGDPQAARAALERSTARGRERMMVAQRIEDQLAARARPTPAPSTAAATPMAAPPPTTISPSGRVSAPARTGTLDLRTEPAGATVLLGGRLLGVSPLRIDLAPGAYQITLRREGSADQTFPVRIEAGRVSAEVRKLIVTVEPSLPPTAAPAVTAATIVVYSDPPGAAVYLDDELLGVTAPGTGRIVKSGVALGKHRLRLSLSGRPDLAKDIDVTAAGPNTFNGALLPASVGIPAVSRRSAIALLVFGAVCAAAAVAWKWLRRPALAVARARTAPPAAPPPEAQLPTLAVDQGPTQGLVTPTRLTGAADRFGEYRLLQQLGRGGMAAVFKAERHGEVCALKRPLPAYLEDVEFLERFLREAELGRTLHHPNIIRIFERGEVGGVPYFTMELVEGETLQSHVRRFGALAPKAAARIVAQVAEALDYAHLKGVVHRDLKPSNIMILSDGAVKVMDYGIARARRFEGITVTGAFLGTPDYVAPETVEGKGTDARSDLYALGVIFYEILTGKKPFVGDTPFSTLQKHVSEAPTPPTAISPDTPRELETIVLRLLRKKPDERYPGAEELLVELRDYLNRAA